MDTEPLKVRINSVYKKQLLEAYKDEDDEGDCL